METTADRRAANRLFAFSLFYLFVLFAALLADHSGGPMVLDASRALTSDAASQVAAETPCGSVTVNTGEA